MNAVKLFGGRVGEHFLAFLHCERQLLVGNGWGGGGCQAGCASTACLFLLPLGLRQLLYGFVKVRFYFLRLVERIVFSFCLCFGLFL